MRVLGFMSGTSLDAVDMAILDTDGETLQAFGPAGERKLTEATRALVLAATEAAKSWLRGAPEPAEFAPAAEAVAREHFAAAQGFLESYGLGWKEIELIGFHGQTVLHERPTPERSGRTVQLGDGALLATLTGVPVAFDFRTADMAAGGEGAPLAPIYHLARAQASGIARPSAVLNVGGVANVTLFSQSADPLAFDTGPGNGMIDLLVQARGLGRYDEGGRLAAAGRVDQAVLAGYLAHPFFRQPPPKSLDRYDFSLDAVAALSDADAAATLVAFTAEAVRLGLDAATERPKVLIVSGGGRSNPQIMRAITERAGCEVVAAEAVGWRGDAIEAEAFAYLAARTRMGLPISFPGTTGAPKPMTGGRIVEP
ncbi:anhydro-N-acetylmuramic acid kinase [Caulobacter sp. S45]|uniref:anhydro-N-acetylmuramic acid kinase n=1 Tax=Caulobacter sp. S45 TaxID=1641861 RepID=UPI00131B679C|nr:anhydro-N-acetylmuramic acid kinase [Caulobacter sp. S45]